MFFNTITHTSAPNCRYGHTSKVLIFMRKALGEVKNTFWCWTGVLFFDVCSLSWLVSMYLMILQLCQAQFCSARWRKLRCGTRSSKETLRRYQKTRISYGFLVIQIENLPNHQPKLLVIDKIWQNMVWHWRDTFWRLRKTVVTAKFESKKSKGFFCQVKDFSHWTKESFSKKAISWVGSYSQAAKDLPKVEGRGDGKPRIFESPTNHCRLEARRAQVLQDQQEEEMRREQEASIFNQSNCFKTSCQNDMVSGGTGTEHCKDT